MKKLFSIALLLHAITGLMALALIAVFIAAAAHSIGRRAAASQVLSVIDIARDLSNATQFIRVERGTANTALETVQPADRETQKEIASLRGRADRALDTALKKITAGIPGAENELGQIRTARAAFERLRPSVDAALLQPKAARPPQLSPQWIAAISQLIADLDALSERLSSEIDTTDPLITELLKIKQLAWTVGDAAGTDRLLVGAAIANGEALTPEQLRQLATLAGRMDAAWDMITEDVRIASLPAALKTSVDEAQRLYFDDLRTRRQALIDQLDAGKPTPISGVEWVNLSNPPLTALINVADTAFDLGDLRAAALARSATHQLEGASVLGFVFFGCGMFSIFFVSRRIARPIAKMAAAMRAVSRGELEEDIPYVERSDEIGELGRALAIFRDKGHENQRRAGELLRQERLSALGQLTATVAHELRNPLSAIRNTVYTFREIAQARGLDIERPIDRIERSITRCDRIISELLDYTRIRELHRSDVLFDKWLADLLNEQKLPEGVILVRNLAAPGHRLRFDAERMRQVVINLVENAAQAMSAVDNPSQDRRIVISTAARLDGFELVIADSGPGIPDENLAKVFEPLFSTKSFGTGLGLPMVKQIVEQHGGKVMLASTSGKGTKITIRLPYASQQEIAA